MIHIPDFIEEAIRGGVNVTVMRHALYGICFDMNLMAKSHMHIVQEDGAWYALMRYDEKHQISDVEELKWAARHGMHGRDFINADWAEFLLTPEQKAERELVRAALSKLTPEEQQAIKNNWK